MQQVKGFKDFKGFNIDDIASVVDNIIVAEYNKDMDGAAEQLVLVGGIIKQTPRTSGLVH